MHEYFSVNTEKGKIVILQDVIPCSTSCVHGSCCQTMQHHVPQGDTFMFTAVKTSDLVKKYVRQTVRLLLKGLVQDACVCGNFLGIMLLIILSLLSLK
jgi:hypothetical protein